MESGISILKDIMEGVDFVLEDTSIIALTHAVPYRSYMIKINLWDTANAFAWYWDRFCEDITVLYLYSYTCTKIVTEIKSLVQLNSRYMWTMKKLCSKGNVYWHKKESIMECSVLCIRII